MSNIILRRLIKLEYKLKSKSKIPLFFFQFYWYSFTWTSSHCNKVGKTLNKQLTSYPICSKTQNEKVYLKFKISRKVKEIIVLHSEVFNT